MARYAHITGWGMTVPERVLTNLELSQMVDTTDEWIVSHTGIRERHIAGPEQTSASLGVEAALQALEVANLDPASLDLIIVPTSSPEHIFPATACLIQDRIGATKAGAFDLSAACTGFIYAVNMAANAIRSGAVQNVLVIGTETLSRFTNWKDRNTCVLFGDGAGAFVLQGSDDPGGVLSGVMHADGSGSDSLNIPAGGSRKPASLETVNDGDHYIRMNGREVYRFATRVMGKAVKEAIEAAHLTMDDLQLIVPHQANQRIIDAAVREMGFPMERCVSNVDRYGNTSTASIPIATCEAIEQGRINVGDKIAFVGFGAGLTWGATVVQWTGPFPAKRRVHPHTLGYRALTQARSVLRRLLREVEGMIWRYPNT
jgi:3-oxoacyl-[acyl-carrier-protein] synthase III